MACWRKTDLVLRLYQLQRPTGLMFSGPINPIFPPSLSHEIHKKQIITYNLNHHFPKIFTSFSHVSDLTWMFSSSQRVLWRVLGCDLVHLCHLGLYLVGKGWKAWKFMDICRNYEGKTMLDYRTRVTLQRFLWKTNCHVS